jgi:hypothetical protein
MRISIDDDTLYDVPTMAKIFGVQVNTIRKLLAKGKIKGKKLCGKWFVTGINIKAYFEEEPQNSPTT